MVGPCWTFVELLELFRFISRKAGDMFVLNNSTHTIHGSDATCVVFGSPLLSPDIKRFTVTFQRADGKDEAFGIHEIV